MSEKPDFSIWAMNITCVAECGEGFEYNLPHDLMSALEEAYKLGLLDAKEDQPNE